MKENNYQIIFKRLSAYMRSKSDAEVARGLGISPQALSAFKKKGKFPSDLIISYCSQHQLSLDDIFRSGGEDEMIAEGVPIYNDRDFVYIPQVTGKISAGGGLMPDNTVDMTVAFRKDWIERKGDHKKMSITRVKGDSMEPTLMSGDVVLVDHARNFVDPHGGIYAIVFGDEIVVKRIQVLYPEKKLKIICDNAKYEPAVLDPSDIVINGKVIWFGRELER